MDSVLWLSNQVWYAEAASVLHGLTIGPTLRVAVIDLRGWKFFKLPACFRNFHGAIFDLTVFHDQCALLRSFLDLILFRLIG